MQTRYDTAARLAAQERESMLLEISRLPRLHAEKARAGLTWPKPEVYAESLACADAGGILALLSPRGPGKTQLAVCLMLDFIARGMTAQYWLAADLFDFLRSLFEVKGAEAERKRVELYQRRLLVIDEIQVRADTEFEDRELTRLIDKRYSNHVATVLIGNLKREAFTNLMGSSIVSRINEVGTVPEIDWPSFRG